MSSGGRRDPALELLRDLAAPAQLSPQAKRRIAEQLAERPARAWSWPAWIAAPSLVALALLVWRVSTRAPAPIAQHDVAQAFVVPACGVAWVAAGEHFAAALVGPADAQVSGGSRQHVALHAGRFIVRTNADRVDVETPDARIAVAPASFAEIEVRALRPTRVAVYTGNARVDVATGRATALVDAGAVWSAGELRRTAVADSAAAAQILAPTSGASQLCPAPAESTVVAAPVAATKPPPPAVGQPVRVRPTASHRASSPATPPAEPVAVVAPAPSIADTTTDDAQRLAAAIHRLRQDHDA
ncbi:MAG TPA: hypothetical protein VIA18_03480, partial [Polyangia bacterium]|nr:hypothetical protein [Polyangia bacterium]